MIRIMLGVLFLGIAALPASAADYWYGGSWSAELPACDQPEVIASVNEKFAFASTETWHWGFAIDRVVEVRETATRAGGPSLVDRRYCTARALLSNGRHSEVVYLIESHQGFASMGWNVESCLPAYDPYRVYDGWCRAIRP